MADRQYYYRWNVATPSALRSRRRSQWRPIQPASRSLRLRSGGGPETLPDLVPTLVYVTLAPFLEGEDAYEVAVG